MPRSKIERIRECVHDRRYDLTAHAVDEMADDLLDIFDIEAAILSGCVVRTERHDLRGPAFVIHGTAMDETTTVGIVGRFKGNQRFLIITVYEAT